jgi:hypothetical protein
VVVANIRKSPILKNDKARKPPILKMTRLGLLVSKSYTTSYNINKFKTSALLLDIVN